MKSFSLSELNRKPGEVADAAIVAPVSLTKRGKPRLVMMPVSHYESLRTRHLAKNPDSNLLPEIGEPLPLSNSAK